MKVLHTHELLEPVRVKLRALLDASYDGDFGDDDWLHALGGRHVLAFEGDDVVAHASVIERVLLHQGRAWRTGYVEALAVAPARRRTGLGSAVMKRVEAIIEADFELGALSTSELAMSLYARRGWQRWRGTTWLQTPTGPERTRDDDDSVFVWPVAAPLDVHGAITCDFRSGDVW